MHRHCALGHTCCASTHMVPCKCMVAYAALPGGWHSVQVYDKEADDNKEATFKLARDTKNPTAFEKERHLGTYRTTQSMAFAPPPEVPLLMTSSHACKLLLSQNDIASLSALDTGPSDQPPSAWHSVACL